MLGSAFFKVSLDLVADWLGRQGDWRAVAALLGNGPDNSVSNIDSNGSSDSSDSNININSIHSNSNSSDNGSDGSSTAYFESLSGLPKWGRGRAAVWQLARLVPCPGETEVDSVLQSHGILMSGLRANGVLALGEEVLVLLVPHRNPKLNGVKIAFWVHRNTTSTHGASDKSAQSRNNGATNSSSNNNNVLPGAIVLPGLGPCRRLG